MTSNHSNTRKIAIQLYTVRDELSKNLDTTLQQLSKIGYTYVEIADTFGLSISEFTKKLKEHHLIPISTHVDFLVLQQSSQDIFNDIKSAGIDKVIVPWIDSQIWQDEAVIHDVLHRLEQLGNQANEFGLSLAYHNHAHELVKMGQGYLLDKLVEKTQHVSLELDIGWTYVATQQDPWNIVERYNKRVLLFHLKDVRSIDPLKFTELGNDGKITWQNLLPKIAKINTGDWIIEQDTDFEKTPLDSAERSLNYLSAMAL